MGSIANGKSRNRMLDIFKAIAIISFVVGHAPTSILTTKFVYSYHLMAFFFASGFAFKGEYLESNSLIEGYIGRMLLKNVKLFVLYAAIYALLHNVFMSAGILASTGYTRINIVKAVMLAFVFYGTEQYMGAFWFIPVILISNVIFILLLYYTNKLKWRKFANAAVFVLYTALALKIYSKAVSLSYYVQVSFLALPVVMSGYFCKKYWTRIEKFITWYGGIIAAALIIFILQTTGGMIELSVNEILSLPLFYPVTFLGLYFCLALAKALERGQAAEFFAYIGKKSYHIMALHLCFFKLIDLLYVKLTRLNDLPDLSDFPTSHYMPGIIYITAGVLIPTAILWLYDLCKAKLTKSEFKKLRFGKRFFKEVLLNTVICALPIFILLFFSPMEVFLGNQISFEFTYDNVWWILLGYSVFISFAIAFAVCSLANKRRWILTAVIFSLGVCGYIQAMLMNGKMTSMDGQSLRVPVETTVWNAAAWIAIIGVIIALYYVFSIKKQKVSGKMICVYLSCALMLMQTTGLVSLLVNAENLSASSKSYVLTKDGEFTLSDKNNLIVFILDTCDGAYFDSALKDYPDLLDGFTGFTYFPNMTSTYNRTFPSVAYLLTQEKCFFNKPYIEYINSAYDNSLFWKTVTDRSDDIRLFTVNSYIGREARTDVANVARIDGGTVRSLNLKELIPAAADIGMYKSAFYAIKGGYEYSAAGINNSIIRKGDINTYTIADDVFCAEVVNAQSLSLDSSIESAFRLYHLFGPHPGNYLDENCNRVKGPTTSQTLAGDFKMLKSYIEQMKALGIYDNSTIIITADHGNTLSGAHLARENETTALLLAKPAHADNSPCKTSYAPVCHEDWFATVIDALGGEGKGFGRTFWEIAEGEMRERLYYYIALYSDTDGEVALREYSINGDATDFDNWNLTGRNWDVLFSERAVSEKRLTDEYPDAVILTAP